MSLTQTFTEQKDAAEAIDSRDRRRSLSTTQFEQLQKLLLSDSYLFTKKIANHNDLVPEIHMPVSYMACGLTDKLIETLDATGFDSYVTKYLRHELWNRGIDWKTRKGYLELDNLLNGNLIRPAVLNFRMARRFFKSSVITHGGTLFIATNDPNETIKITHAVDPKAWEFCEQIAKTVLSGTYRDFFPDRIPKGDLSKLVTMKKITLGGRTISHPQTTIQASGIGTSEESAHYSMYVNDDIIADDELSVDEVKNVVKWQKGMTGFYMPTRRIRRLEVGTKHDEDDDDTFLTTGLMAKECLTLRVPIEEHDGEVVNILKRGKPTCPKLFPKEKITAEQSHVLNDEADTDGYRTWWNQYLLSAIGGGLRLFPSSLVDDRDRWWFYEEIPVSSDSNVETRNRERRKKGHFIAARFARDEEGNPIAKKGSTIYDEDKRLCEGWHENAELLVFDPWKQFDRVCLVDPSWSSSGNSDNWAVTAMGCDHENVAYQLQTQSATTGTEGWIDALAEMDERFHFRVIGFDGAAMQDAMIQQLMKRDKRLRRMASRMVKVPHNNVSKTMRMKEGVAEPMKVYRLLLAPPVTNERGQDILGGNMTRDELKGIKSTPKRLVKDDEDGIADSLAMFGAVRQRKRKPATEEETRASTKNPYVHPALGVPYAA